MARRPDSPARTRFAAALTLGLAFAAAGTPASRAAQTPPAAVKNLTAWYDASDTSTITIASTTSVSRWSDKSGNGETLAQSTHAAQPVYASASLNGLGALQFSGAQVLTSNDAAFSRLLYPAGTAFIVQSSSSNTQSSSSVWSGASQTQRFNLSLPNNGSCPSIGTGANGDCLYFDFGDTGATDRLNAPADTDTTLGTHLFMGTGSVAAGSAVFRRDGATLATVTPTSDTAFTCALTVGARGGCVSNSSYFNGSIGEIVIYDTILSAASYQLVEGVLACKWSLQSQLPAGHPYKSSCPNGSESANLNSVGGLSAWYDANDASTITTVTYVSQINDKSGQGNTLTQATAASQPYLAAANGAQALNFSGGQGLVTGTNTTFATGANPSSMFLVAGYTGSPTGLYALGMNYGASTANGLREIGKTTSSATPYVSEFGGDVSAAGAWTSATSILYGGFGAAGDAVAFNGGPLASGSATPNTPASSVFSLGSHANALYDWSGPIFEVLLYNSVLSTAEQQFVEGYLACKWSIQSSLPATHPYRSTCPSTASANLTLALAVAPSGVQPPGTDLAYTTICTNASGTLVYNPVVNSPVPANTWFKVGTATQSLGSTGLSPTISYSSDGGTTYGYAPVSGAGGAAAGYDAKVTNVRWTLAGALGPAPSIDSASVTFTVRII